MCYHVAIERKVKKLETHYGKQYDIPVDWPRVNGFDHKQMPLILDTVSDQFYGLHWGLIPNWCTNSTKAMEIRKMTLNAKSETACELASFKGAWQKNQRGLLPVSSFFEWRHEGKNKIPYQISLNDYPLFTLACLWDTWENLQTGKSIRTFTILTTDANELMAEIHNTKKRMPSIILPEYQEQWLAGGSLSKSQFQNLTKAIPSELMVATINE